MYHRIVALLLLPFVLTSQSVTFGHCHGNGSPSGHDPRPHVHLNRKADSDGHQRRCCGHHHDDDEASDTENPSPDTPSPSPPSPCQDSEAIFFGGEDAVVAGRMKVEGKDESSTSWCAALAAPFASFGDIAQLASDAFTRPPPSPPPCPLYVRHLALLI